MKPHPKDHASISCWIHAKKNEEKLAGTTDIENLTL
jgi:hypothetical protein